MGSERNRVLLVVDGSDQSFHLAEYASRVFNPANTEINLFHVLSKVPDAFWDWEEDPLNPQHLEYMKDWEAQKEQALRQFMGSVQQSFTKAGFPDDAVTFSIQERQSGIARDIIQEARRGYDAVLIGRKGLSTLDEAVLGSVASKVLTNLTDVAVCLVGGRPNADAFLVGLDGSQGASRAVDFAAKMVSSGKPTLTLLHVLRAPLPGQMEHDATVPVSRPAEEARKALLPVLEKATQTLVGAGCAPVRIKAKTVTGASSRAGALIEAARQDDCGTIIVGRRGVSKVADFHMGRVPNKLAQAGKDLAIWIAS